MDNKLTDNNGTTILACRYCPMCRHVCSSEFMSYKESDTPRGRAILLYNIYEGGQSYDADTVDAIYNCFLCGCCLSWCQGYEEGGYNIPELIKFSRRDIVNQGLEPEAVKELRNNVLDKGNIYGIDQADAFTNDINEGRAEVLYYLGVEVNFKDKSIAESTLAILKKAGVENTMLNNEPDCGKIMDLLGYQQDAKKLASNLYDRIEKSGCKLVITSDPLAYDAFINDYPSYGLEFMPDIRIKHVSEYLYDLIKEKKIELNESHDRVAIVDSEFIGRYNHVFDTPRDLLKKISSIDLVELEWNRNEMLSTGESAFYFSNSNVNIGKQLGKKLLKLGKDKKVGILVTLSALAKNNIAEANDNKIKLMEISEYIGSLIK